MTRIDISHPSQDQPGAPARADSSGSRRARWQRAAGAVRLLAVLALLQALAVVVAGLLQVVESIVAAGSLPLGAVVLMGILFVGYGLWLGAAAQALVDSRLWSRALILLTQVFLVIISWQAMGSLGPVVALPLVLYGLVVLLLLFSGPVQRHLLGPGAADSDDAANALADPHSRTTTD